MQYALCHLSVVPLRKKPSDTAEMVSQILFGESLIILGQHKNWYEVKLYFDDYQGFIDKKQCCIVPQAAFKDFSKNIFKCVFQRVGFLMHNGKKSRIISLGASFPITAPEKKLQINGKNFEYSGEIFTGKKDSTHLIQTALKYLNTPYLWGGRSIFGIDCSGFTQMVYKINGYKLHRDAHQQAAQGIKISINQSQKGDLAFFKNDKGKIIHVGILMESNKILHAHGQVRIDNLDAKGIYNTEKKTYTHYLHSIRTYI